MKRWYTPVHKREPVCKGMPTHPLPVVHNQILITTTYFQIRQSSLNVIMMCLCHHFNLGTRWDRIYCGYVILMQSQDTYLREWLIHKEIFLSVLHDMEAPPEPRVCTMCGNEGIFRCTECTYRPLVCGSCCITSHEQLPFHQIERWTGRYFEEYSLRLVCGSLSGIEYQTNKLL